MFASLQAQPACHLSSALSQEAAELAHEAADGAKHAAEWGKDKAGVRRAGAAGLPGHVSRQRSADKREWVLQCLPAAAGRRLQRLRAA